eukprot:1883831-Prymnesium_polylepis.1
MLKGHVLRARFVALGQASRSPVRRSLFGLGSGSPRRPGRLSALSVRPASPPRAGIDLVGGRRDGRVSPSRDPLERAPRTPAHAIPRRCNGVLGCGCCVGFPRSVKLS